MVQAFVLALTLVQAGLAVGGTASAVGDADSDAGVPGWDELVVRQRWSTDEGLPQSTVTSVVQTRDGFLWVGTHGGLARFDGERFEVFGTTTEGLEASRINCLLEASSGDLWIGTAQRGVVRLRDGVFESVRAAGGYQPTWVEALVEDSDGTLWVGAEGLLRLVPGADELEALSLDPQVDRVYDLEVDAQGRLLVASRQGLLRLTGGRAEVLIEDLEPDFHQLVRSGERIWGFGGRQELFLLDGTLVRFPQNEELLPALTLYGSARGSTGPGGEVLVVGNDRLWQLRSEASPGGQVVSATFEPIAELGAGVTGIGIGSDRTGNVWVGSGSHGLLRLGREPFRVMNTGLTGSPAVWSLFPDGLDGVLGHLMGGELLRTDRELRTERIPLGRAVFTPLEIDPEGNRWIAGDRFLTCSSPSGEVLDRVRLDLTSVERLERTPDGALWVGSKGAVGRYFEGGLEVFSTSGRQPVHDVLPGSGPDGRAAWLLATDALYRWSGDRARRLDLSADLTDVELRDMLATEDGTLWITTYGRGLLALRPGSGGPEDGGDPADSGDGTGDGTGDGEHAVRRYGMGEGLLDEHLGGLRLSRDGRLYLNSNRGTLVLSPDDIRAFDRGELGEVPCRLLRTGEGNGPDSLMTRDGLIWFPTMLGLAVIDPALDVERIEPPNVRLAGVAFDGGEVSGTAFPGGESAPIELEPGHGHLEFRYVAASFGEPGGVRYRHRLEGHEGSWAEVGPSRTARYRAVPPGDYVFRVVAKSGVSGWGEELAVPIRLRPHFYQTPWFLAAVGGLLLLLAWLLHWGRTRTLRRHSRALQAEVRERRSAEEERSRAEEQLRESTKLEAVGRLAGGIAHDFNNVLTAILGHVELMKLRAEVLSPQDVIQHADTIEACSVKAGSLTQQLLAFSRRQVLRPRVIDVNAIVLGLEKLLTHLLPEAIELRIRTSPDTGCVLADPSQLEQVVMNLVLNARDAMPAGGELVVRTARETLVVHKEVQQHATITVEDTGRGIHPDDLPHVFEPFFTTKGAGGTGLGLASVHGIVAQSGGQVLVDSEPGRGSSFRVMLPSVEGVALPEAVAPEHRSEHGGDELVLICDDYDPVRSVTRRTLEAYGYSVLVADHPERALELARGREGLSLLITDFTMPGMTGRELADRMLFEHPNLRVLFISGYTTSHAMRRQVVDNEVAFLQKPFAPEDLARSVRQVLDGAVPDSTDDAGTASDREGTGTSVTGQPAT